MPAFVDLHARVNCEISVAMCEALQMELTLTEAQINVRRDGSVALLANEGEILFRGQCAKELQQAYAKQESAVISVNFKDQTGIMSF